MSPEQKKIFAKRLNNDYDDDNKKVSSFFMWCVRTKVERDDNRNKINYGKV